MMEFKLYLQAKMKAIDDELGATPASQWDTLRVNSLQSRAAHFRDAFCVYLEYEEALNAQAT